MLLLVWYTLVLWQEVWACVRWLPSYFDHVYTARKILDWSPRTGNKAIRANMRNGIGVNLSGCMKSVNWIMRGILGYYE